MKTCTLLWCEAHLEVKSGKKRWKLSQPERFWKIRCRKVHSAVARSTFNKLSFSWWKSISLEVKRVKMYKTHQLWTAFEVVMSKTCMALWCKAHLEAKMNKAHQERTVFGSCDVKKVFESECWNHHIVGPLLDVQMSKKWTPLCSVVLRGTLWSRKCEKIRVLSLFWSVRCRLVDR